ncbi:uncharacterized protein A4U43_C05F890 [Asparagus officinalis]|uniref:PROP1-like PPR domain-containing protein n=1 Tax=Asparagus officinalis TaxID=4686 RepID=A0A5P1ETX7_ASPOF|nr:pentatricopeptide repeat-containing protein At4g20740 [Asparagus officinalis]ONK67520.1 uncharacterized protein A4U43_C05F890 [Asparagus officinalis]
MREEVCTPDVFAYTAILKVLANAGNFEGCLRVWEEMRRDKVDPDAMAYATIVSGLCKNGNVDKGVELFREMKKKGLLIDRAVYGAIVDGFVRIGSVEDGFGVFKEMVDDGYRPDLGIYDSLIWGLCEDGRIDKARRLFQVAISEGLTLDFGTVTPLMIYYADSGEMDRFFRLIDQIEELGLPVMDHLADFFTVFLRKGERELNAVEVFEALKGKGYCSVAIYNILIKALYKSKEGKRAVSLFEEIKSSQDLEPDTCTYSLVIPCYVDVEDVREACSCYNKMRELSWIPSVEAYCSLVKGLCKIGEINPAITLVKDCLGNVTDGPMEFKYTLTILNACRLGKPEKVIEVLNEMMEEGYPFEDIIYCAVIHGFCKHASSEEARKVFAVLKNRNILSESSYIGYEDMLNEHLKKVTAGLVISTLKFYGLESKLKLSSSMD